MICAPIGRQMKSKICLSIGAFFMKDRFKNRGFFATLRKTFLFFANRNRKEAVYQSISKSQKSDTTKSAPIFARLARKSRRRISIAIDGLGRSAKWRKSWHVALDGLFQTGFFAKLFYSSQIEIKNWLEWRGDSYGNSVESVPVMKLIFTQKKNERGFVFPGSLYLMFIFAETPVMERGYLKEGAPRDIVIPLIAPFSINLMQQTNTAPNKQG